MSRDLRFFIRVWSRRMSLCKTATIELFITTTTTFCFVLFSTPLRVRIFKGKKLKASLTALGVSPLHVALLSNNLLWSCCIIKSSTVSEWNKIQTREGKKIPENFLVYNASERTPNERKMLIDKILFCCCINLHNLLNFLIIFLWLENSSPWLHIETESSYETFYLFYFTCRRNPQGEAAANLAPWVVQSMCAEFARVKNMRNS